MQDDRVFLTTANGSDTSYANYTKTGTHDSRIQQQHPGYGTGGTDTYGKQTWQVSQSVNAYFYALHLNQLNLLCMIGE